ncbi:MAG: pentapeptide repeat-containing protein, partial [Cyanobacteria bacterium J06635_10]
MPQFIRLISNTNLDGANLRYAELIGVRLDGASLRNADLRGANLDIKYIPDDNFIADASDFINWGHNRYHRGDYPSAITYYSRAIE